MVEKYFHLLNEARGKNRWRNTASNQFAKFLIKYFKDNPEHITEDSLTFKNEKFIGKIDNEFAKRINEVSVTINKVEDLKNSGQPIQIIGAKYFGTDDTTREFGSNSYTFNRGDINIEIEIDSEIDDFYQLDQYFNYFVESVSDLLYHELIHLTQDFSRGLADVENKSPYYFLTNKQKEDFNYLMDKDETEAYVGQAMKEVARLARDRRQRVSFIEVLDSIIDGASDFQPFIQSKNKKINNLVYLIKYKYIDYASRTYNSVRQDPQVASKLEELGEFLDGKGLYVPLEDNNYDQEQFQEWLKESSDLSKYWKKRAKARAKRAGRHHKNKIDKVWAMKEQERSTEIGQILKKTYEKDIKETEDLTRELEEILSLAQAKKHDAFLDKATGRRKGFLKNAKKHPGQGAVAQGETYGPFGPSALEESNED
jgi:hypothetical protein